MSDPFDSVALLRIIQANETTADYPGSEEFFSQLRENWEVFLMLAFYTGDSGTATENPTETVLTDDGAAYDVNEHNGRSLVIIDGLAAGNIYTIDDTAATALTCTGDTLLADGVLSGDAYKIFYNLKNTDAHTHDDINSAQVVLADGTIMLPYYMSEEETEHLETAGYDANATVPNCRIYVPTNASKIRVAARLKGSNNGNIGIKLTVGAVTDEEDPYAVTNAYAWYTDIVADVSTISGWQDAQLNIKATAVNAYLQGFSMYWEN